MISSTRAKKQSILVLPTLERPFEDAPLSVRLVEGKMPAGTLPAHTDRLVCPRAGHSVKRVPVEERAR